MNRIKIAIIGAGNISNTRHIPALLKLSDTFEIVGVVSDEQRKLDRTRKKYQFIHNELLLDLTKPINEQLANSNWFNLVDAVISGTPPKQHYLIAKECLLLNKHVLTEKPMMLTREECEEVNSIAEQNGKVLMVMHSFQFSNGMLKLKSLANNGELGNIKSILELQLSNRERRLPIWYNDLPLGLFFDEASHFFYSARAIGGELKVLNAKAIYNSKNDATPRFLEAQMMAGEIPVQMYMNFNSPICEWGICVIGDKKIAIYDYFKDILIVLPNDGQHYAKDVLRTSISFTSQFWKGFIKNGFLMITNNLLYGHDACLIKYANAINKGEMCFELSGKLGIEIVSAMNDVVKYVEEK